MVDLRDDAAAFNQRLVKRVQRLKARKRCNMSAGVRIARQLVGLCILQHLNAMLDLAEEDVRLLHGAARLLRYGAGFDERVQRLQRMR